VGGDELVELMSCWQSLSYGRLSNYWVWVPGGAFLGYFFQSDPLVSSHTSLGWVCAGFLKIMCICQAPPDCSSMVGHGATMHQWNDLEIPAAGRPKCRQGSKMLSHCDGSSCSLVRHSEFLRDGIQPSGCPVQAVLAKCWVFCMSTWYCILFFPSETKYTPRLHQASLDLRCSTMVHCWYTSSMVRQGGLWLGKGGAVLPVFTSPMEICVIPKWYFRDLCPACHLSPGNVGGVKVV